MKQRRAAAVFATAIAQITAPTVAVFVDECAMAIVRVLAERLRHTSYDQLAGRLARGHQRTGMADDGGDEASEGEFERELREQRNAKRAAQNAERARRGAAYRKLRDMHVALGDVAREAQKRGVLMTLDGEGEPEPAIRFGRRVSEQGPLSREVVITVADPGGGFRVQDVTQHPARTLQASGDPGEARKLVVQVLGEIQLKAEERATAQRSIGAVAYRGRPGGW
jgi:hypothetical protein